MACNKFSIKDLDAYRDGMLDDQRRSELSRHLDQCAACRESLDKTAEFEQQIKDVASSWIPSDKLWARIRNSVEKQSRRTPERFRPKQFTGIAAAITLCTFAFMIYLTISPVQETESDSTVAALVNEFHTFVISRRELDYREPQPGNVRDWFGSKVEFRVPLPLSTPDIKLAGGRLCNMFDQRIVSFMYQVDGVWVSLYIMQSMPGDRQPDMGTEQRVNGYGYVQWQYQGLHYSLVGDLPANHLHRIAERLLRAEIVTSSPDPQMAFFQTKIQENKT